MSGQNESQYILVNAYEDLVKTNVRAMMENVTMCKCEKCFLDVCAIVFNDRYTHYVTTKQGELLTKVPEMGHANRVEMMVSITKAIKLVADFPKHG